MLATIARIAFISIAFYALCAADVDSSIDQELLEDFDGGPLDNEARMSNHEHRLVFYASQAAASA